MTPAQVKECLEDLENFIIALIYNDDSVEDGYRINCLRETLTDTLLNIIPKESN